VLPPGLRILDIGSEGPELLVFRDGGPSHIVKDTRGDNDFSRSSLRFKDELSILINDIGVGQIKPCFEKRYGQFKKPLIPGFDFFEFENLIYGIGPYHVDQSPDDKISNAGLWPRQNWNT